LTRIASSHPVAHYTRFCLAKSSIINAFTQKHFRVFSKRVANTKAKDADLVFRKPSPPHPIGERTKVRGKLKL